MNLKQEIENTMTDRITSANQITAFCHCHKCVEEWKEGKAPNESPSSYARLDVGFTPYGLQVWCNRHECNVLNIDFQGQKHPAVTS
jgi:hypothetical protein